MDFADNMKAFVAKIEECHRARSAAVADIHAGTVRLRDGARTFMDEVEREHHKQSRQVRSTLAESQRARREQVREMREAISADLHETHECLNEMLHDNRAERQEHLGRLMHEFQGARKALAGNLREAGRLWRNRARR